MSAAQAHSGALASRPDECRVDCGLQGALKCFPGAGESFAGGATGRHENSGLAGRCIERDRERFPHLLQRLGHVVSADRVLPRGRRAPQLEDQGPTRRRVIALIAREQPRQAQHPGHVGNVGVVSDEDESAVARFAQRPVSRPNRLRVRAFVLTQQPR